MIEGNVIKFGYGDIAVWANFGCVLIQQIKPPQNVGESVEENAEYIGTPIYFALTLQEVDEILEKLKQIETKEKTYLEFHDYVLDFSNYHNGSVKAVNEAICHARKWLYVLAAC